MNLKQYIRDIPDFPKKGIIFKDITTLLKDPRAFQGTMNMLYRKVKGKNIDVVVAAESRGFIFGAALAYKLKCGFVPVRKPGKLPAKRYAASYSLEYGTDTLEIHQDAFPKKSNVLIIDDLLATGGTCSAIAQLVKKMGGKIVSILFLIELSFLHGRKRLKNLPVDSIIQY